MQFTGGAGEANRINVDVFSPGTVTFREMEVAGPTILAQGGCTNDGPRRVNCTLSSGSVPIRIEAGDGSDSFSTFRLPSNPFTMIGGDGDDRLTDSTAAGTRPVFFGEAGNDFVFSGDAGMSANGGEGNDTFFGRDGADNFTGSVGNDSFSGGGGNDTINGSDGDDSFTDSEQGFGALTGNDTFNGGAGIDTVKYFNRNRDLRISLDGLANDGGIVIGGTSEADNIKPDVERVTGGKLNDTLTGSGEDNVLRGQEGDDLIRGLGGADTLDGGAPGTDNGFGVDNLQGGTGADRLEARDAIHDTLSCGSELDLLDADLVDDKLPLDCESVTQGAIREGKNVRVVSRRLRLTRGFVRVRLSCPRSVGIGCRGTLALAALRRGNRVAARGRTGRYRISAGRSKVVRLRVARADVRRLGRKKRKVAQLSSFERGTFGKKVTVRVVRLR